ncbi:MAG: DegV family protein [Candidatus Woesearchaeota archaeon]
MDIKLITDSCCDLPRKLLNKIKVIPISLLVDGKSYKEGINLTKEKYYDLLQNAKEFPGSSAPSPYDYLKELKNESNIFILTVSSSLSSSYNNAIIAKNTFLEKYSQQKDTFIHVFDSLNASIGQGLLLLKLQELISENLPEEEIINKMDKYINQTNTFFILEKLDNLINSGRINRIVGKIISTLNVKLIMGKTNKGEIKVYKKVRGSKRTFNRLIKMIGQKGSDLDKKILGIAHYNCLDKALKLKKEVSLKYPFKDIIITKMGPTISTYADEGALLISF